MVSAVGGDEGVGWGGGGWRVEGGGWRVEGGGWKGRGMDLPVFVGDGECEWHGGWWRGWEGIVWIVRYVMLVGSSSSLWKKEE